MSVGAELDVRTEEEVSTEEDISAATVTGKL